MEIFHYVSNELKDVPLFSSELQEDEERLGAIYNDFDNAAPFDSDEENTYFFTQPDSPPPPPSPSILPADVNELILDVNSIIPHDLNNFDCDSETPNWDYRKKVYDLLIHDEENIIITDEIQALYRMRYDCNWSGPDSVYDLWLLGQGTPREWFPVELFEAEYPDYIARINEICHQYIDSSDTESELETTVPASETINKDTPNEEAASAEKTNDETTPGETTNDETKNGDTSMVKKYQRNEESQTKVEEVNGNPAKKRNKDENIGRRFRIKKEVEELICISDTEEESHGMKFKIKTEVKELICIISDSD